MFKNEWREYKNTTYLRFIFFIDIGILCIPKQLLKLPKYQKLYLGIYVGRYVILKKGFV